MSSLTPLGTRQYQNTGLAGSTQQPARGNNNAVQTQAAEKTRSNVALSSGAVDLQQRIDSLGNNTIDLAQNFLGKFAQQLLGDDAKGATIAFDSVSLEASSSMSAGMARAEGANGVGKAGAFSLNENSHFLGTGTITLADGSKYEFEVEVRYEASMSSAFAAKEEAGRDVGREARTGGDKPTALPTFDMPEIEWPGSLGDLFKLMDKQVSGDVKDGANGDVLGNLSVRLMQLIKNTQSLDIYEPMSPVKAYAAESAAGATDKTQMPIKVPTDAPAPSSASGIPPTISTTPPPPAGAAEATGKTQMPIKVPTDAPAPSSASDIPLTISTSPPGASEPAEATGKTQMPIKVPTDAPAPSSASDIPLTISTTPPPADEA
ncbi:hypothetical protein [Pseudoduganella lutea]|uniref:Uncharacterized protein n=1 Tax=Pseudoduganella lutea TaxID=321985 RepID=A0A4P6L1C8_9BURK|nr:hypothetical protein [Pseudoduganella lutea]QBE65326.1 hypothetical protein EWM63_21970 [Pseudoduganella lutea]